MPIGIVDRQTYTKTRWLPAQRDRHEMYYASTLIASASGRHVGLFLRLWLPFGEQ